MAFLLCLLALTCVALSCAGASMPSSPLEPGGRPRSSGAYERASRMRPRTPERSRERRRLADRMIARGIGDLRVVDAIQAVPRHWFVPEALQMEAYEDVALAVGHGQTISQPYIVALMTEALALEPGSRVLDIGTGSGYQAAVLSELADVVHTIEIVPELAERSRELFRARGYTNVVTRLDDGTSGWPEAAPFDAVIVTAAPLSIPRGLVAQLAPNGRMCVPIGPVDGDQELLLIEKRADGSLASRTLAPVRFVPLAGGVREGN